MPSRLNLVSHLVALLASLGPAMAEPCTGGAERTVFGEWGTVPSADSRLDATHRDVSIAAPTTTRYIRVLIEVVSLGAPGWTLTIRDVNRHILQIIGVGDINAERMILTHRLATNELLFGLSGPEGGLPNLLLRQQIVMPFAVTGKPYYSRKQEGIDDWKLLYDLRVEPEQRNWGDNVAFLMIGLNEGSQPATCTGIALPPDLLLTNWHCGPRLTASGGEIDGAFWSSSICDRTLVDLSWDDDAISREFICKDVLAKSQDLDYALLRISPIDGSAAIGAVTIDVSRDAGIVSMIHHPAASKKVISSLCQIHDRALPSDLDHNAATAFTHDCDSERGSSGAPIFDNHGALIGLHHRGFEKIPGTANCDNRNKAVWIDAILSDLKHKQMVAEGEVTQADLDAIDAHVLPHKPGGVRRKSVERGRVPN